MRAHVEKSIVMIRLVILCVAVLAACQPRAPTIDLRPLATLPSESARAVISDWPRRHEVLVASGISDRAQRQYLVDLIPEILADLALFGAGAQARPRDVRMVLRGEGSADIEVSLRALPLFRTVADLRRARALPANRVRTLVLDSALSEAINRAPAGELDLGQSVISLVFIGLAHDGRSLISTGPARTDGQQ